jgi:ribonucleotide reductase alpha subunit
MGEEKKYEVAGDPIKMLLKETLEKQRNVMMDKFSQIIQRMPTGSASTINSHSGGITPFKVQVNFNIPIFEGQIDADVIDRRLNLL